jgi:hypothetical protein
MADSLVELLDRSTAQPFTTQTKATILRIAVHMYTKAGAWEKAQRLAERTWPARKDVPLGILLTQAYVMNGRLDRAEDSLATLHAIVRPIEAERLANLASLESLLAKARQARSTSE